MPTNIKKSINWRDFTIALFIIISFVALFFVEPISQDPAYHNLADNRTILGINNFFDVVSNLPFLFTGLLGLFCIFKNWGVRSSWGWLILFISVICVSFGSSYYHLNPENKTLTWDRLPMAISFMALFVIVLADYVNNTLGKWLLIPMCLVGIFSVAYWHMIDDLRMYAWVQFVSMALLLIIISVYKPTHLQTKYLIYAFIFYTLSKLFEHFDKHIYELMNQFVSGHTIKHLFAAIATFFVYLLLKRQVT